MSLISNDPVRVMFEMIDVTYDNPMKQRLYMMVRMLLLHKKVLGSKPTIRTLFERYSTWYEYLEEHFTQEELLEFIRLLHLHYTRPYAKEILEYIASSTNPTFRNANASNTDAQYTSDMEEINYAYAGEAEANTYVTCTDGVIDTIFRIKTNVVRSMIILLNYVFIAVCTIITGFIAIVCTAIVICTLLDLLTLTISYCRIGDEDVNIHQCYLPTADDYRNYNNYIY